MLAGVPLIVGLGHVKTLPLQSRSQFRQAALSTDTLPNCNLSTVFSTGNLFVPSAHGYLWRTPAGTEILSGMCI